MKSSILTIIISLIIACPVAFVLFYIEPTGFLSAIIGALIIIGVFTLREPMDNKSNTASKKSTKVKE